MSSGVKPTNLARTRALTAIESALGATVTDGVDWSTSSIGASVSPKDQWKQPVRVASTASVTVSTALNNGDTIDGVTLGTGDRVLLKDQATGSQNGIYVVGVTPVRAADMDADDEVVGALVYVVAGTANTGKAYKNTNTTTPTVGSTSLTFVEFGVGMTNPMTTQDDIIVGGVSGVPARLAKGSDSQVLTVDPTTHHLLWATPSSGFSNPMTTKGDLIVGDTGGAAIRKAIGTDTYVLTADAASTGGMKWAAPAAGGSGALILLEQHTASSSASLDFTTCLTSTYDEYLIEIVALTVATNGAVPYLRFSTDGGSTYDTSTIYHWNSSYLHVQGGVDIGNHAATGVSRIEFFEDGSGGAVSSTGVPGFVASARLYNPLSAAHNKLVTFSGFASYSGNSSYYQFQGGGAYISTTAVNAFRIVLSTGNIAAGTVRCYGIAK